MNDNFLNIDIHNDETLLAACDVLHDGYCDISKIKFNQSEGTWQAPFEREFLEDTSLIEYERKYLIFTRVTFPVVHSVLFLSGITSFKIKDKSNIRKFVFNECQIKNSTYAFLFCENMEMFFTFEDKPMGNLKDHHFLEDKQSFLTTGKPFLTKSR